MTRREKRKARQLARTGASDCRNQNIALGVIGGMVFFFLASAYLDTTALGTREFWDGR